MPKRPVTGTGQINAELPTELLNQVKTFAKGRGESLREVLMAALIRHMANPPPLVPPPPPVPPPLPVYPPLPPVTAPGAEQKKPAPKKPKKS